VEFSKCLGIAEVEARLRAGQLTSAILCDLGVAGVDRDLVSLAQRHNAVVIAVSSAQYGGHSVAMGAHGELPSDFTTHDLLAMLQAVAAPVTDRIPASVASIVADRPPSSFEGELVAVCARGGAGASIVSMALTQGIAGGRDSWGSVALVDWTLNGDQATYHDSPDVIPATQELVEAHRHGCPQRSEGMSMLRCLPDRGYSLLLGLRQRRDWTTLTPTTVAATCDSLRRWFRWTIADVTAEFEGEAATGSFDVEDRHCLARTAVANASVTVAVGTPTLKGIRDLVRLIDDLVDGGCDPARVLPVINHAPRQRHLRSEITTALGTLGSTPAGTSPAFFGTKRTLESILRCSDPLPPSWCDPLASAVRGVFSEVGPLVGEQLPVAVGTATR